MMCAVDVPAFMIHAPLILLLSGKPSDAALAPGSAIVMCILALVWSAPASV